MLKAYQNDLHAAGADIMAKNLTLTAEQAAKFWPEYSKFQAEEAAVVDQQLKAMKTYTSTYATLDDAAALAQVGADLDRDLQINTLRKKWLVEFRRSCGPNCRPGHSDRPAAGPGGATVDLGAAPADLLERF